MNEIHCDLIGKVINGRFRVVEVNDRQLVSNIAFKINNGFDKTTIIIELYAGKHVDNEFMQELFKREK